MLSTIKTKIRALAGDFAKSDFETFTYENDSYFFLSESNVSSVTKVEKNGSELGSGDWDYDSTNNKVTISAELSNRDTIIIYFTYTKYSDTELTEYIRGALVHISLYSYCSTDYEIEDDSIIPTPDNKTTDLIAIIASILLKPNYSEYRIPNITVKFPRTMDKYERIRTIINRFRSSIGENDVLTWDTQGDYYGL